MNKTEHHQQHKIAFIGAGNMASAIIGGLVTSGFPAQQIIASNPSSPKLERLAQQFSINTTQDNQHAANEADIIILAVKPWFIADVCQELAPKIGDKLVVSVAAGKEIEFIAKQLSRDNLGIARAMPNTPCLVQQGAIGLYADPQTRQDFGQVIEQIFNPVGYCAWLENEQQINVITTLSGSAPAFYFYMSEALAKAGAEFGLDSKICKQFIAHTALGAGKMLLADEHQDAHKLRQQVTSPNGTTHAATSYFDEHNMQQTIIDGVKAGVSRGNELAKDD